MERVPIGSEKKKKERKKREVKLSIWGYVVSLTKKGRRNWFKSKLIFLLA